MPDKKSIQEKISQRVKPIPKGRASDLARAIEGYKAKPPTASKPRNTGPMGEERPNSRGASRRTKRDAITKARPDTRYS